MAKLSNTSPYITIAVQDAKLGWVRHGKTYRSAPAAKRKARALAESPTTISVIITARSNGVRNTLERFDGLAASS